MKRCTAPIGSTTARWLVTTNRFYSTPTSSPQPSSQDQNAVGSNKILHLLFRWKPSTASPHATLTQSPSSPVESATTSADQNQHTPKESLELQPEPPATTNDLHPLLSEPSIGPITDTAEGNNHALPASANDQHSPPLQPPVGPTKHALPFVARQRRPLPLSPLMDPAAIAAKQKHHVRKLQPSKNPEPFQQKLAQNPYAQALATPLRRCQLTFTSLPSFFLQDFNLMAHPETGHPWYVPRSLTNKHATAGSRIPKQTAEDELLEDETQPSKQLAQIGEGHTPKIGFTVYTLSNQLALRATQLTDGFAKTQTHRAIRMAKQHGLPLSANVHFVPERYRVAKAASNLVSMAAWRNDMHELVLNLMRRRTIEDLVHVTKLKRGYVVGCSSWEDAMAKPQVGAFLWTGGDGGREMEQPPEFATLNMKAGFDETRKVPVHNLRALLGREKLDELREKLPNGIFEREVLVLRHKKMTVEVQMRLWKLQGYLAEYREFFRDGEKHDGSDDLEDEDDIEGFESDKTDEDEDER